MKLKVDCRNSKTVEKDEDAKCDCIVVNFRNEVAKDNLP